jgi:hypothetical protein
VRIGAVTALAIATAVLTLSTGALPAHARIDTDPVQTDSSVASIAAALVSTVEGSGLRAIERGHVLAAMVSAHDALVPATAAWLDELGDVVPSPGTFSVAFDNGRGSPSGLPDSFGSRAAVLAPAPDGSGFVGAVVDTSGASVLCATTATTAAALLDGTSDALECAGVATETPVPTGPSAVTTMWAWGNPVDPAVDNRGLGQPGMAPAAIAEFASAHGLSAVYLSAPWASNEGAIATWLRDCVAALHGEGIVVSALGGDTAWLDDTALAARWVDDALAAADFDAVQLDVEPWVGQAEPDFSTITPRMTGLLDAARVAAGAVPVGIDLPWWVATKPHGSRSAFDAIVDHADSVAIVAFADHAGGTGGIVPLATDAVRAASTAGTPFTIGVETDTPAIAGGAQFTFYDEGPAVLETEVAAVRAAFGSVPGYRGITVEHLLAWSALLANDRATAPERRLSRAGDRERRRPTAPIGRRDPSRAGPRAPRGRRLHRLPRHAG